MIRAHKWLVFHYTVVGLLALCHAAFCWRFRVDIEYVPASPSALNVELIIVLLTRNLEDPSIFQIDIGRIIVRIASARSPT